MSTGANVNISSGSFDIVCDLDQAVWSEFAAATPAGNIFHTPEMFRVFQRAARYHPTCWAAVDSARCPLALLLPVEVAVLDGPLRLLSTRAIVYGGALCHPSSAGRQALSFLLREYKRHVEGAVIFTELRNQDDTADLQPLLQEEGFCFEGHLNYLIDLAPTEDELWHRMHRTRRQNVHTAEREGIVIQDVTTPEQVPEAYAVLRAIYHHINVPLPDESLFDALFADLNPRGMLNMMTARLDHCVVGVVVNLIYKDRLLAWYGGSDRTCGPNCANELLNWHSICWARERGLRIYDFGGAGKPDEPYGPRDYKARFGGQLVNYGRNTCVHAPRRLAVSRTGYQLWRRLPHFPEAAGGAREGKEHDHDHGRKEPAWPRA